MENFKHNLTSNYQVFFHQAGSCQMEGIVSLYNYIMSYLVGILFVVTTALIFIIIIHLHGQRHINQFKTEKNINELIYWMKYLQKWTHSTTLELIWTIIPTIILIAIAIPSFILLYSLDEIVDTQCVVKIIAYQWYWKYEYPVLAPLSNEIYSFSYLSYMLPLQDLTEQENLWLLEVDTPLVLPINVNSKLVITSKDVIHSFAVPALGIKMDAVPGRLNQVTVHIFKSGTYYGQCSELCGVNHAFMPIVINAVDFSTFEIFLWEGLEISAKKFFTPFESINDIVASSQTYLNILNILPVLENEELSERFLYTQKNFRDELLVRTEITLTSKFENISSTDYITIYTEVIVKILEFEKRLLRTISSDSPVQNLGFGHLPDGTRSFIGSSDDIRHPNKCRPAAFAFGYPTVDKILQGEIGSLTKDIKGEDLSLSNTFALCRCVAPATTYLYFTYFEPSISEWVKEIIENNPTLIPTLTEEECNNIIVNNIIYPPRKSLEQLNAFYDLIELVDELESLGPELLKLIGYTEEELSVAERAIPIFATTKSKGLTLDQIMAIISTYMPFDDEE